MKKNLLISAVLLAAMIIAPLTALERTKTVASANEKKADKNTVSVMLTENGKITETDEREYVIGALAAEMDMSCHEEALKAQAVACFTYLRYTEMQGNANRFGGADISDDSNECQGYIGADERKNKWGDKYDEYEKKAEKVVDAVLGQMIGYENQPILAVYHELNSGSTLSAQTVWGKDYPYLQSVESAGDRLSAELTKTVVMSEDEFKKSASKLDGAVLSEKSDSWFSLTDADDSGFVRKVKVGGKEFTGEQFRKAFSLASCNFSVSFKDGKFTVKSTGKGHMVGMSQYGADYMARQGSDYRQILTHYYQNTEII